MIYLTYKNFCRCHNVPPHSTTIKNNIFKEQKVLDVYFILLLTDVGWWSGS
jgi:hypothetical protein